MRAITNGETKRFYPQKTVLIPYVPMRSHHKAIKLILLKNPNAPPTNSLPCRLLLPEALPSERHFP